MLSTGFVRSKTAPQQQSADFQSLFLSLSGLSLTSEAAAPSRSADPGVLAACLFPSAQNVVFGHSSFFKQNAGLIDLPSPAEVRQEAARQFADLHGSDDIDGEQQATTLVPIPSLGLLVKYGPTVLISEAKTLMLLRRAFPQHQVPVPEVFGWRREGNDNFIYMSLPEGVTLLDGWHLLSEDQKIDICTQVRDIVRSWRRLRQNNSTRTRIESIDNTPLHDTIFTASPPLGTFLTVASFHEWFVTTAMEASSFFHGARVAASCHFQPNNFFRDDTPVVFTHGGFHPGNIVISTGPNPRVVSILDWSQAGWYPAYWEFCKARRAGSKPGIPLPLDWETTYLSWILDDEEVGIKKWGGTALCHYWEYFVGLMERAAEAKMRA